MQKFILLCPLLLMILSGCNVKNMVNETIYAMQANRQAIEMSTYAIEENAQAVQDVNQAIEENKRQLEAINATLKHVNESSK